MPPTPPVLTPHGLPEMPDVSVFLDKLQDGISEINIPKPPTVVDTGQFFLGMLNRVAEKLGLAPPFPTPFLPPPPVITPAEMPKVPQVPKTASPFKLPF